MFVVVVGGGKVGSHIARLLLDDKHKVALVEKDRQRCEELKSELPGVAIVCGDGNDPEVLRQADIQKAEGMAAVTSDDEDNLVIGLLGRREFGVRRIVGRVNNPRNEWLFNRRMGIDAAVNPAAIVAHLLVEEVTVGDMATLVKLRRGNMALVEMVVDEGSPAAQQPLGDIRLPAKSVLVAVMRDGTVDVPSADMVLRVGDELVALTDPAAEPALAKALTGRRAGRR